MTKYFSGSPKDTLKALKDFKNKQQRVKSNAFLYEKAWNYNISRNNT